GPALGEIILHLPALRQVARDASGGGGGRRPSLRAKGLGRRTARLSPRPDRSGPRGARPCARPFPKARGSGGAAGLPFRTRQAPRREGCRRLPGGRRFAQARPRRLQTTAFSHPKSSLGLLLAGEGG